MRLFHVPTSRQKTEVKSQTMWEEAIDRVMGKIIKYTSAFLGILAVGGFVWKVDARHTHQDVPRYEFNETCKLVHEVKQKTDSLIAWRRQQNLIAMQNAFREQIGRLQDRYRNREMPPDVREDIRKLKMRVEEIDRIIDEEIRGMRTRPGSRNIIEERR